MTDGNDSGYYDDGEVYDDSELPIRVIVIMVVIVVSCGTIPRLVPQSYAIRNLIFVYF